MSMLTVGVDVGKSQLDVAACTPEATTEYLGDYPNNPSGWEALAGEITKLRERWGLKGVHLVMEPTGGYEQPLALFAHGRGWVVSLPNPRKVREWARGVGRRAKTDRTDAQMLAEYGAAVEPSAWHPLPEEVEELRELLERRDDLRKMLGEEKNRRHALKAQNKYSGLVAESMERTIEYLERELSKIEESIREHVENHPNLKEDVARLQQVPGIGSKNVLYVLITLYRWGSLTGYQGDAKGVTAYVGLDPLHYSSGSSVHRTPHISRQGNSESRRYLYMGALGGIRGNNSLREFYLRLVHRGKPKKLALVAAARKILVWAWAVFRDHTTFDPARACSKA